MKLKQKTIIICILFNLALTSCREKITEPFLVTYKVDIGNIYPYQVMIYYEDSFESSWIYTDTCWTKTVLLPPDVTASLSIYSFILPSKEDTPTMTLGSKKTAEPAQAEATVSIICSEKTIHQTGNTPLHTSLSQRDILMENLSIWKKYNPLWMPPKVDIERYEQRRKRTEEKIKNIKIHQESNYTPGYLK